jgi:hypothetical protein
MAMPDTFFPRKYTPTKGEDTSSQNTELASLTCHDEGDDPEEHHAWSWGDLKHGCLPWAESGAFSAGLGPAETGPRTESDTSPLTQCIQMTKYD